MFVELFIFHSLFLLFNFILYFIVLYFKILPFLQFFYFIIILVILLLFKKIDGLVEFIILITKLLLAIWVFKFLLDGLFTQHFINSILAIN